MILLPLSLVLALAVQTTQGESLPLRSLRQAWSEGEISRANMHAVTALEALEERGCAVSPLAASLLFYTAVSDQTCQCDEVWGYSFWAALEVDERVGGLTAAQREIANQFASAPGADRSNDWAFARSPYLGSRMLQQEACETLEPLNLAGPGRGEGRQAAFLYTRIRTFRNGRVNHTLPVMGYPEAEAADMAEHLIGYRDYTEERNEIVFYRFTPCLWMNSVEGGQSQLCRSDWLEGEVSAP